jgi:hypothetical protein
VRPMGLEQTGEDSASKSNARAPLQNFSCGFCSGLVITALLNPYDRALYLAQIKARPFLNWDNFRLPYQGVSQTIVQRSISSGICTCIGRRVRLQRPLIAVVVARAQISPLRSFFVSVCPLTKEDRLQTRSWSPWFQARQRVP